jgi:hypothetical protein
MTTLITFLKGLFNADDIIRGHRLAINEGVRRIMSQNTDAHRISLVDTETLPDASLTPLELRKRIISRLVF